MRVGGAKSGQGPPHGDDAGPAVGAALPPAAAVGAARARQPHRASLPTRSTCPMQLCQSYFDGIPKAENIDDPSAGTTSGAAARAASALVVLAAAAAAQAAL